MFKDYKTYLWGIVMGLVVIFAFGSARPVGTATVYEKVVGNFIEFFNPEYVYRTVHYYESAAPVAEWETMFVIGLVVSGFLAKLLFKKSTVSEKEKYVPAMWSEKFGSNRKKRYFISFIGGILLLFGARLANGCTSGHFISGGSQLALSAYIFAASMFITGILTATMIYRKKVS